MGVYPVFQHKNPYNILANLLVRLRELNEPLFSSADDRDSFEIGEECEQDVEEFWESLAELSDTKHILSHGVSQEVETAIRQWRHYDSFSHILVFLVRLDSAFHLDQILSSAPVKRLKDGFTALNSNVEETGLLLISRVKSVSDDDVAEEGVPPKRNWIGRWLPGMNQSLKNTYYMEVPALKANSICFSVRHRIVDNLVSRDRKYIRIAFSPVLRNPQLDVQCYIEGGHRRFSVSGVQDPERIRAREKAAFTLACREKADVLVFPEMLGDKELVAPEESYSEILDIFSIKAEKEGLQAPHMVFSSTWWHERRNELHIFDNRAWRLCVQQKQFPYLYPSPEDGQKYLEDLRNTTREIQVLHVPDLGRICIPICKDALDPEYMDLMVKILRATILLNPSYSAGKTMFVLAAPSDRAFGCYRFWFNACGIGSPEGPLPGYIGIVSCPVTGESVNRLAPACNGVCGGDEEPCLFLMDLVVRGGKKGEMQNIRHLCGAQNGETLPESD